MRLLVLLLLAANLTFAAYIALDAGSGREPERLAGQIEPARIRVLTPQQVAALGPAKQAALPNVCLEWGPFTDPERERALAILNPFELGRLLSTRRVEVPARFWVFIPQSTRGASERRVAMLREAGFSDVAIVEGGDTRFAVSLGQFRTEEAARVVAARVRERGFTQVQVGNRERSTALTLLVVRDPQTALLAAVREARGELPAESRTGPCAEG